MCNLLVSTLPQPVYMSRPWYAEVATLRPIKLSREMARLGDDFTLAWNRGMMCNWLRLFLQVVFAATMISAAVRADCAPAKVTMIQLTRHSCRSVCPDYVLTLRSEGCGNLKGNANFVLIGSYSSFLIKFDDAVEALASHRFSQMARRYPVMPTGAILTDAPWSDLTVYRTDGSSQSVTVSEDLRVPASVTELFHIIDGIGLTAFWFNDDTKSPVSTISAGGTLTVDPATYKPCS